MKHFNGTSQERDISELYTAIIWERSVARDIEMAALPDSIRFNTAHWIDSLSAHEREIAQNITDRDEHRHYVLRRCFQRVFVKSVLSWGGPLASVRIEHNKDTQPKCLDAQELRLSFSSSGPTLLACASQHCSIGIDIERQRLVPNATDLAQRFFTPSEAEIIQRLPMSQQSQSFLKLWTAKEAGLKAIGRGVVSGLNSLSFSANGFNYTSEIIDEFGMISPWRCVHLDFVPNHVVAVVHSP
jgi:phosphopantetheinyl transferase